MDDQTLKPDASVRPSGPVWLTYVELGERLRITPDAARQKAIRGRYRKQRGNDGKARVLVEPEVLELTVQTPSTPDHPDNHPNVQMDAGEPIRTPEPPSQSPTEAALVALLEDQIGFLKGLVEAERARADRLQGELLDLAKTHTTTLERHAAELRQANERMAELKRPWWRRLAS